MLPIFALGMIHGFLIMAAFLAEDHADQEAAKRQG